MKIDRPKPKTIMPDSARCVFHGVLFDVYQWDQKMFDGSIAVFERIKRPDTTTIFPVLSDGRILLSRQTQPDRPRPFINGFGGQIDEGEDVLSSAKRELREEAGYEADTWTLIKAYHPYSKLDWALYVFVAHGARRIGDPILDTGEKIDVFTVAFDELLHLVDDPDFVGDEIQKELYQARLDPVAYQKLKALFTPK